MSVCKRATVEVQIDSDLLHRAQIAGVDLDTALETAIRRTIPRDLTEDERRWNEENREAIDAFNSYVEKNGLPLERYRRYPWPSTTSS